MKNTEKEKKNKRENQIGIKKFFKKKKEKAMHIGFFYSTSFSPEFFW